jgi:hypothetical protein
MAKARLRIKNQTSETISILPAEVPIDLNKNLGTFGWIMDQAISAYKEFASQPTPAKGA